MSKRSNEPEEALGPAVDGLKWLDSSPPPLSPDPEPALELEPEAEQIQIIEYPVALLCGHGIIVDAVASLAESCGFIVEIVMLDEPGAPETSSFGEIIKLPDFNNFVLQTGIERNYFVGIFLDDPLDCEAILLQCLESHAAYLGLYADKQMRADIFASLRADGVPDAELAAVRCPIGLNIGAVTPEQLAVAVVAEFLATKNGTMKRLLNEN